MFFVVFLVHSDAGLSLQSLSLIRVSHGRSDVHDEPHLGVVVPGRLVAIPQTLVRDALGSHSLLVLLVVPLALLHHTWLCTLLAHLTHFYSFIFFISF